MAKKFRDSTEEEIKSLQARALDYGFDLTKYNLTYQTKKNTKRVMGFLNHTPVIYVTHMGILGVPINNGLEETSYPNKEHFKNAIDIRLNYSEYQKRAVEEINAKLERVDTSNMVINKVYVKETYSSFSANSQDLPVFAETEFGEMKLETKISMLEEFNDIGYISLVLQNTQLPYAVTLNKTYEKLFKRRIKNYLNSQEQIYIQDKNLNFFKKHKALLHFLKDYKQDKFFSDSTKIQAVLYKSGKLKYVLNDVAFEYRPKTDEFKCSNEESIKKIVSCVRKNSRKANTLSKHCSDVDIDINSKRITVNVRDNSVQPAIKMSFNFEDEIDTEEILNAIKSEKDKQKKEQEKKDQALADSLKAHGVYESILVEDILYFLERNNFAITANSIAKALKGSSGLNHLIKKTELFGVYTNFKEDEILDMINNMYRAGLLSEKTVRGSYGRFKAYSVSKKGLGYIGLPHKTQKNYENFTDFDWRDFLKSWSKNPKTYTEKENEKQLSLLDRKAVVCRYSDLVKEFINTKPESWKNYVEAMYSLETGLQKKYWKNILNMFEKKGD